MLAIRMCLFGKIKWREGKIPIDGNIFIIYYCRPKTMMDPMKLNWMLRWKRCLLFPVIGVKSSSINLKWLNFWVAPIPTMVKYMDQAIPMTVRKCVELFINIFLLFTELSWIDSTKVEKNARNT